MSRGGKSIRLAHARFVAHPQPGTDRRPDPGSSRPGSTRSRGRPARGKSILIDALNLLLGERADKTLIRSGTDSCTVEAELELRDAVLVKELNAQLEESGAEPCEGRALLLKRTVSTTGTNRQFINGSPVPLQALKSLGDRLVDVHGPHDHQSLLANEKQAELLDAYGKLGAACAACAAAHRELREVEQERAALAMSEAESEQRLSLLQHQVGEIQGAKLQPGEDVQLDNDFRAASHAQNIVEQARTISSLLNDSDNSVMAQLAQIERALKAWERMDGSITEVEELNRAAIVQLTELLDAVQARAEKVDLNPEQMRQLEERLNLVQSLKRKYGGSLENVVAFGEKAAAQLAALEDRGEFLAKLAQREKTARQALGDAAAKLTTARRKVSKPLAEKIAQELRGLGFKKSSFAIEMTPAAQPGPTGARPRRVHLRAESRRSPATPARHRLQRRDGPRDVGREDDAGRGRRGADPGFRRGRRERRRRDGGPGWAQAAQPGPIAPGALHHPSCRRSRRRVPAISRWRRTRSRAAR